MRALESDREVISMSAIAKPAHLKPHWAAHDMRLDPTRLPQAVSYAAPSNDDVTFTISTRGATLQRRREGIEQALAIALPARAFRGVAARAIEDEDGHVTVTLELLHPDETCSVPLLVAHDLEKVSGDWHRWAELYNLPMLLVEDDGIARTLEDSLERYQQRHALNGTPEKVRVAPYGVAGRPGSLGIRLVIGGQTVISELR
jgi:Family of unknown function (DUF6101)